MPNKRFSRRDFLRLSAVAAAGAALGGCACEPQVIEKEVKVTEIIKEEGAVETVVVQATAPPTEPSNVVIFIGLGTGGATEQIEVHAQIQEDFNAESDMHKIEFLTSPWADGSSKLRTLVAAGEAPDLCGAVGIGGTSMQFDLWGDIQPYVDADAFDLAPLGAQAEIMVFAGKGRVGLPIGNYPTIIYYNADLFDAVGLDYPPAKLGESYADGDAWTFDKLVEISKLLTIDGAGNDADSPGFDSTTTVQFGWNGWDWNHISQYPAHWGGNNTGVSEDYRTAEFNAEAWVDCFQFHYDAYWTWHIRATGEQAGGFYAVAGDPMGSGMVGMWENHTWMGWAFTGWTDAFNWGIAAVPTVEGADPVSPLHADGINFLAAGQQKDAAWWVLKRLVQPEWAGRLTKNWGAVPAHVELSPGWADSMAADYPDVNWETVIDAQCCPDNPHHEAWKPEYSRIMDEISNAGTRVSDESDIDVAALMDELNATAQTLLDSYWEDRGG